MASTPEMVDSVKAIIFQTGELQRRTLLKNKELVWFVWELYIITLNFLWWDVVRFHEEYAKTTYCNKNYGSYQSVWLGRAAASSLQSRTGSRWFPIVCPTQRIAELDKVLSDESSKEYNE